jgi:hypothetical protein
MYLSYQRLQEQMQKYLPPYHYTAPSYLQRLAGEAQEEHATATAKLNANTG